MFLGRYTHEYTHEYTHNSCISPKNVLPLHSEIETGASKLTRPISFVRVFDEFALRNQSHNLNNLLSEMEKLISEISFDDLAKSLLTVENDLDETNPYDPDMRLSPHFTLEEFTRSGTARRLGLENIPCDDEVERMRQLCIHVLEPLRKRFGVIRITSGFRTHQLNDIIGGARNSQHLYGEAADIHVGSTEVGRKMYDFIMQNLDFDQLLLEVRGELKVIHCLHISYKSDRGCNRRYAQMLYPVQVMD